MLFLWNGKSASPLVKAVSLTKGFELDNHLIKGKEQMLHTLFSGAFVRGRKIQRGGLALIDNVFSEDENFDNLEMKYVQCFDLVDKKQELP